MARQPLEGWIPEERGSALLQTVADTSAVEAVATREPMSTDSKVIMRPGTVGVNIVPKGGVYPEDVTVDSEVTLVARKFGTMFRLADEDMKDSPTDHIARKQSDWVKTFVVEQDNACFGVTGAENGTTVPFTSVYRALNTADTDLGYTAGANIVKTAGDVTYAALSGLFSVVEASDRIDEIVVVAHPAFKGALREVVDGNQRPLFVEGLAGTPDTLFGYRLVWSRGAKTSAVATSAPEGNPLLIVAGKNHLILGVRSSIESAYAPADSGAAFASDEALLKVRARRGFVLGHPNAAAILEITAGV